MFKAINKIVDGVTNANTKLINTYFVESAKQPALAMVQAQSEFATAVTQSSENFVNAVKAVAKV